jgi:hypothetical protein
MVPHCQLCDVPCIKPVSLSVFPSLFSSSSLVLFLSFLLFSISLLLHLSMSSFICFLRSYMFINFALHSSCLFPSTFVSFILRLFLPLFVLFVFPVFVSSCN